MTYKQEEIWKPIPGWDKYEVSSEGRVKRLAGYTVQGRWIPETMMKLHTMWDGRRRVTLKQDGRIWNQVRVAQLMLLTFVGPRPTKKHHARHLDDNTDNDTRGNLAWGTASQNARDAFRNGSRGKLTKAQIKEIRKEFENPKWYGRLKYLANKYNVSGESISSIMRSDRPRCVE